MAVSPPASRTPSVSKEPPQLQQEAAQHGGRNVPVAQRTQPSLCSNTMTPSTGEAASSPARPVLSLLRHRPTTRSAASAPAEPPAETPNRRRSMSQHGSATVQ